MGAELVKIEGKDLFFVLDNTLDQLVMFFNFEGCVQGFRHFGRKLGVECSEDYVLEFFEEKMSEIFEEEELKKELKKIKEYFE